MKFHVDRALTHQIFDEKFGGIENFATPPVSEADDVPSAKEDMNARSATTIYGWLKNGMPASRKTIFDFFGRMDVDPIAVVDVERSKLTKIFGRLRHAFMMGGMNAGGFGALFDIFRPGAAWPDNSLAQEFYGRDWTIFEFDHPATDFRDSYATITLCGDDSVPAYWPRAFHIAYRRHQNADGLWRPYGTVLSRNREAILAHENGHIQVIERPIQTTHRLQCKTYFGGGPAEFRMCSVHPFVGTVEQYDDPSVELYFPA